MSSREVFEVELFTVLPYASKKFATDGDRETIELVYAVKNNRVVRSGQHRGVRGFDALWSMSEGSIREWVGSSVLVPIPPHVSGDDAHSASAPYALCRFLRAKLGVEARRKVSRENDVPKSSAGSHRVTVEEHIDSLKVANPDLVVGADVMLLDDVVTKGSHMIACTKLLLDAGASRVRGFAAARTILAEEARFVGRQETLRWMPGWSYPRPG